MLALDRIHLPPPSAHKYVSDSMIDLCLAVRFRGCSYDVMPPVPVNTIARLVLGAHSETELIFVSLAQLHCVGFMKKKKKMNRPDFVWQVFFISYFFILITVFHHFVLLDQTIFWFYTCVKSSKNSVQCFSPLVAVDLGPGLLSSLGISRAHSPTLCTQPVTPVVGRKKKFISKGELEWCERERERRKQKHAYTNTYTEP